MSGIMDEQQVFESLYDYIQTKDWWLFICPFHGIATDMLHIVEDKFYKPGTDANVDFHMTIFPPFGVIFMARKSRMSYNDLVSTIIELKGSREEQDVIALIDESSVVENVFWKIIMDGVSTVAKIRKENIETHGS